jgi:hypothetical protein
MGRAVASPISPPCGAFRGPRRLGLAMRDFSATGHQGEWSAPFHIVIVSPVCELAIRISAYRFSQSWQPSDISALLGCSPGRETIPSLALDVPPGAGFPRGDLLISGRRQDQQMSLREATFCPIWWGQLLGCLRPTVPDQCHEAQIGSARR